MKQCTDANVDGNYDPCPVEVTLCLIDNKWKIFILRDLLEGEVFFGEFLRSISGISKKVLTENLKAMENTDLIIREEVPGNVAKVKYKLSPLGESMRPMVDSMKNWGDNYMKAHPDESVQITKSRMKK